SSVLYIRVYRPSSSGVRVQRREALLGRAPFLLRPLELFARGLFRGLCARYGRLRLFQLRLMLLRGGGAHPFFIRPTFGLGCRFARAFLRRLASLAAVVSGFRRTRGRSVAVATCACEERQR